jgi:hypothetical protein
VRWVGRPLTELLEALKEKVIVQKKLVFQLLQNQDNNIMMPTK